MRRSLVLLLFASIPLHAASQAPVRAPRGMVASVDRIASQVGVDVMKKGGNAVDAAIAVGFALAVTWPGAGNLGGGGFMLVRKADGAAEAIDYRERAPLAATRTMYLDEKGEVVDGLSTRTYKAVGVPGTVAGMALAHKRHGKLKWADLVEPARKLAADGFLVSHHLAQTLAHESSQKRLNRWPESRRIFLRNGKLYEEGERFAQPELAATLARIQKNPRDFYEGETARILAADMRKNEGLITLEDLKRYEATVREPVRGTYRGYQILSMPPPSSGGIALIGMLHMLEPLDLKALGWGSAHYIHNVVEVQRRAFADRASHLGDTDFVTVPVEGLLSRQYAMQRRRDIDPYRAMPSVTVKAGTPHEPTETTHFSIIDAEGNVVSNTYTINDLYGAGMTVPGLGFLLNDEMDDFTSRPGVANTWGLIQGDANAIQPRKRPLSSMTPTIVAKDGKFAFAIGSPGGPSIINTVLHVIVNVVDFGMDIQQAIESPRFHHQWLPDHIFWEEYGISPDTRAALVHMGHLFRDRPGFGDLPTIGDAQGVAVDPATGVRLGGSDPRRGGAAFGY
ncbi:MAG TPA: gamma-glutamyltransferase [Thermoanaerobaculia bacterium]|nr:gamma-glutamyltransferase [Thermoanaerobaculia bacterium]